MDYKLAKDVVVRQTDGACIPFDLLNVDYQAYLVWLAAGNVPDVMEETR